MSRVATGSVLGPILVAAFVLCSRADAQDRDRPILRRPDPAVEWKLTVELKPSEEWSPVVAQPGPRVVGPVEFTPAAVEYDEELARAAIARLEARASMLLADLESSTGATAAHTDPLEGVLQRAIVEAHEKGKSKNVAFSLAWLDAEWNSILSSAEWRGAVRDHLSDEMRAALTEHRGQREDRLLAARQRVALVMLASELRLRAPQVAELEGPVAEWVDTRLATKAQMDGGDVVAEMLLVPSICAVLTGEQLGRLRRMRSAARPAIPNETGAGDDIPLGRGRYPEDDFVLEACAVAQANGWLWKEVELLQDAATMLGREYRRNARSSWKHGDRNLVAPIVDFSEEDLWWAVVERVALERGTSGGLRAPQFTGNRVEHVGARAELVLALLDERLLLSDEQVSSLRGPLQVVVGHEFDRGSRTFGAVDGTPVWRALRIDGALGKRRGAAPRKALVAALRETLEDHQLEELGL